jgi:hypothetical protein
MVTFHRRGHGGKASRPHRRWALGFGLSVMFLNRHGAFVRLCAACLLIASPVAAQKHDAPSNHVQPPERSHLAPATTINAELAEPAEKTGFVLRVLRFLR